MNNEPTPPGPNDGALPPNPLTMLNQVAGELHEIFRSLTEAGFTEWQACRIIGTMLGEQGRQS